MKRFYKNVSVADQDGYVVLLDDRPIKTPNEAELKTQSQNLAQLSADEWDAQKEDIIPDSMPVTQLLNTRIDRVSVERDVMFEQVLNYINTDLLCYWADHPEEIVKRQKKLWQQWLDWFEKKYGIAFQTTNGLGALKQDDVIHEKIKSTVSSYDDDRFTLFQMIVPSTGSIVLALAFMDGAASVEDVMACAYLEEDYKFELYNEEKHGGDPLTEKKRKALLRDLKAAKAYLDCL